MCNDTAQNPTSCKCLHKATVALTSNCRRPKFSTTRQHLKALRFRVAILCPLCLRVEVHSGSKNFKRRVALLLMSAALSTSARVHRSGPISDYQLLIAKQSRQGRGRQGARSTAPFRTLRLQARDLTVGSVLPRPDAPSDGHNGHRGR